MHDGRGKNRQAYLWQYSRPKGPVVFDFRLGREREGQTAIGIVAQMDQLFAIEAA